MLHLSRNRGILVSESEVNEMRKHYRWNPLTLLKNLSILVLILLMLWLVVSYGEILVKNTSIDVRPIYSSWNFFTMWMD